MQTYSGTVDGYEIIILVDDPWKSCHLYVRIINMDMVVEDDDYPNVLMLSANLTARVMFGNAVDFLTMNKVPRTDPLWDLNHSDMWQRTA